MFSKNLDQMAAKSKDAHRYTVKWKKHGCWTEACAGVYATERLAMAESFALAKAMGWEPKPWWSLFERRREPRELARMSIGQFYYELATARREAKALVRRLWQQDLDAYTRMTCSNSLLAGP